MSFIRQTLGALIVAAALTVQANADAGFDQERIYKALGVNISSVAGKKCTIFTKTDAEQTLHGPVVRITAGTGKWMCAYELAQPETAGIRVWREPRSDWQPPRLNSYNSHISHVKGVGQDAYTYFFYVQEGRRIGGRRAHVQRRYEGRHAGSRRRYRDCAQSCTNDYESVKLLRPYLC